MFSPKFLFVCLFVVYLRALKAIKVIFFLVFLKNSTPGLIFCALSHRYVYLGLGALLRGPSFLVAIIFYTLLKKHFQNKSSRPLENGQEDAAPNKEDNCKVKEHLPGSSDAENESSI